MKTLTKIAVTMLAVAVFAAGCGFELHPGWDGPLQPDGPIQLHEATVYLDTDFEQLVVLRQGIDDEEPTLDVEYHDTATRPVAMEKSADGRFLYVINRGERHGDQSLSVYRIGEEEVERDDVALDAFYDRIDVDPEGDFVVLSSTGEDDEAIVQNLQAMAVVDLRGGVPEEADVMTLRRVPEEIEFLPPFTMDGQSHRLLAVTATNNIEVVDLNADHDASPTYRAPLSLGELDEFVPRQVVFEPPSNTGEEDGIEQASLFVLARGQSEVTQIQMQTPQDENATRSLSLSINQLAAGSNPGLIEVFELGDGKRRLLALDSGNSEFTLVDVDSQESATHSLPLGGPASGMELFHTPADDGGVEQRILVYSTTSQFVAVIRPENIALGDQAHNLGTTVEEIRLEASPSEVRMREGDGADRAVVLHAGGNDGFSVLKLDLNQAVSWRGSRLSAVQFDGRHAYGIYANEAYLERVDVETDRSTRIPLPQRAIELHLDRRSSAALVRHEGEAGRFTVLNRASLEPEDGRLYEQVFLNGVLERPAEEQQEQDDE